MTFTILHNKNCSKSRACIQILESENIDFTIRDYIKNPLSLNEVKHLIQNLLGNKFDILRNKTEKDFDDKDLIKYIFENQKDLQRPIFFDGKNYIVCRPPDKVLEYI